MKTRGLCPRAGENVRNSPERGRQIFQSPQHQPEKSEITNKTTIMRCKPGYTEILLESFYSPENGHRGHIHIRPAAGQHYSQDYFVECSRAMTDRYPVGTIFRLALCLKATSGGRPHLYAHYGAPFEVVMGQDRGG